MNASLTTAQQKALDDIFASALSGNGDYKTARAAMARGANPRLTSSSTGNTYLHGATWNANIEKLKFLVTCGVPVEAKNNEGLTAFHQYIRYKNLRTEIVDYFLANDADPLSQDKNGKVLLADLKGYMDESRDANFKQQVQALILKMLEAQPQTMLSKPVQPAALQKKNEILAVSAEITIKPHEFKSPVKPADAKPAGPKSEP